jgi:hypothetical protein
MLDWSSNIQNDMQKYPYPKGSNGSVGMPFWVDPRHDCHWVVRLWKHQTGLSPDCKYCKNKFEILSKVSIKDDVVD